MIRFNKTEAEWDFAEQKKTCRSCGKEYAYYVYRGGSVYHSCIECEKCQNRLWYYPEEDLVLDKYFGDQNKRDFRRMKETIESLASPCSCGGNYRHANVSTIGIPKDCPYCSTPQDQKEHVAIDCTQIEVKPSILRKFPVTVLRFYDDTKVGQA